uniref:uncharacterized protein C20orf173 homolog isoform X1 n=1 Tax=Halichoerus grypus TaxID=9711 RepID=UPI001659AD44|nr:uncharacterized protein C20orf173 homolog isoform X1 [Halichoerus grypus]XP_035940296.1 uncharacterized protein C20orf173 homolog isoform X1 [Halichoerus grypus]XP_035940297.1 uncharacterized protein C20orf173 homolog isoform X1 [Halichoerus grypus]
MWPNVKHLWQIFVLWVFWVLLLWLMAPCLDPRPESAPQEKLMVLVPLHCNRPWLKLRTSGCPSEMLNSSLRHHRVGEGNGFAACYGKTVEYLTGATESLTPVLWWLGMNSASGLGQMWEKLFKVIPRPSVSHFHLYCGTCALVGYPTTLRASGLSHNVNQCTAAFRMSQGRAQGFETAGNQTTGRFVYSWNTSIWGSWRQLVLLLLKLSGLAWTSDAPSEEVPYLVWGQTSS